ncbi:MAG: cell envelope integrity protein TolA [Nitrospirae bacterium]|nr:cell envelope integrity protein TolA [Nitrospirota bacterium]
MRRSALSRHRYIIRKEPDISKIIIASALLHLLFASFIAVPLVSRQKEFRSYLVNIVDPLEIEPAEETAYRGETDAEEILKNAEIRRKPDASLESARKFSKEIERLRAIEKLSALKKLKEKSSKVQVVGKKGSGRILPSVHGEGAEGDADSYYGLITRRIWQQWIYPDIKTSGLETMVSIKISGDGKIISQKIEKSSGNALFDRSALNAVSKASPLPPPPVEMEIGIRFYL